MHVGHELTLTDVTRQHIQVIEFVVGVRILWTFRSWQFRDVRGEMLHHDLLREIFAIAAVHITARNPGPVRMNTLKQFSKARFLPGQTPSPNTPSRSTDGRRARCSTYVGCATKAMVTRSVEHFFWEP